ALVSLSSSESGTMTATVDENGSFEFRGLAPGMIYAGALLSSAEGSWTSDRLTLVLGEGDDHGPVELRLRRTRQVSGIVQSALGPVPGASVAIVPFRPIVMFGDAVRTDLDGSFSGNVPAMTDLAAAVVSAPGFALRAFALPAGQPAQILAVSEEEGNLELRLPEPPQESGRERFSLWVFQNGLPLPLDTLYPWAAGHGQEPAGPGSRGLAIPAVAPGEYRACIVSQALLVPWEASGWTAPLAKCAVGDLAAGSTLRLDLER
ncbi:MAG TPA: carboxypeptidase-like regulatory domain-containing protein, partial [Thermoanaerobaculia bacterium]|nr:carboxypeptidase-like regulatory domain-containing protein [Thermoanaerobaculia bacterium]